MPAVSGFTIVRNAIRLDFPLEASLRSILPLCDELVVNVGRSEDETLELVRSIDDSRIRVLESEWGSSGRGEMLARETQRAMDACRHPWGVYIQADEVLHEQGVPLLREGIRAADADPAVEGLLVDYLHFYGSFDRIATNRRWYRREVRAVRLGCGVRSFADAQGFRVGPEQRRIRARRTGAVMFHYGWARPPAAIARKREADRAIFSESVGRGPAAEEPRLYWTWGLRDFRGAHPAAAEAWIRARAHERTRLTSKTWRGQLRFMASDLVERVTGWEPFPYRNYIEV
jgi:hypothetical protein